MRLIFALLTFWASICTAAPDQGLCDFPVPDRVNLEFAKTGLSHSAYNRVIAHLEDVYTPIFAAQGCQFQIVPSWSDPTINAQAWREGNICYVEMFGGLARERGMTAGAYAEVGAHEIGHHLGGVPYFAGSQMSVEGQADYYATAIGMYTMGIRSQIPSRILADELAKLAGDPKTSLPGPQLPAVRKTQEGHPYAQCRRVTYEAGRMHLTRPTCWYHP